MGERNVHVGRDAVGSSIVTGDHNTVATTYTAAQLPPAEDVNMAAEVAALRRLLTALHGGEQGKIGRALDDAEEELKKPAPDRDEVGGAIERAVKYAKGAGDFADHTAKLAPHLKAACGWLGSNWHKLLAVAGVAV